MHYIVNKVHLPFTTHHLPDSKFTYLLPEYMPADTVLENLAMVIIFFEYDIRCDIYVLFLSSLICTSYSMWQYIWQCHLCLTWASAAVRLFKTLQKHLSTITALHTVFCCINTVRIDITIMIYLWYIVLPYLPSHQPGILHLPLCAVRPSTNWNNHHLNSGFTILHSPQILRVTRLIQHSKYRNDQVFSPLPPQLSSWLILITRHGILMLKEPFWERHKMNTLAYTNKNNFALSSVAKWMK